MAAHSVYGAGAVVEPAPTPLDDLARSLPGPTTSGRGGVPAGSTRVLSRADLVAHAAIGVLWLVVNAAFWAYWIPAARGGDAVLAVAASAAVGYQACFLPTVFWAFVGRMRRPVHRAPTADLRVAVITLCVPSLEAMEVIERQLEALSAITYPHDSWVLDEGGSDEVRRLAARHGVRYFSRKGIDRWNREGPPFQARTKAGNVNAWLGHVRALGLDYEAFVQLDVDHRPVPEYLDRVLGHLDDPEVAWVQAPSVCRNLDRWTARGLAEQEVVLQGPLQMGFYGATSTPFIIGSHTTYRTSAVRQIGGFQPTRAEDHLDTVVLAAEGFRGVFVPEVLARGDGPEDLRTYARQQYAWAHSMVTVFLHWTPRLLPRYAPRQALQFLFSQSWYVLWSLSLLAMWVLPLAAAVSDRRIADTTLLEYVLHVLPVALAGWLMWSFARPWFQPEGVGLSWRGAVLAVLRWPVVLWAMASVVLRIKRPYMVTPKGRRAGASGAAHQGLVHGPLAVLAALAFGAVWVAGWASGDDGRSYALLVMVNGLLPLLALGVAVVLDVVAVREASGSTATALRAGAVSLLVTCALVAAAAATTVVQWDVVRAAVS
ncbi:glycosyltransferase family 2 protein [Conexibacter sp. SYSU D00693]|uniref:glycosyltransferase family 2 protein n=1 Tax=Conexibacter sp. SYSU D00693 TaxID=2812560 RepID=UPI00196A4B3A|nr:glycosyltransferase family 2 protein [Conexibacter sp. SYSU D00693]